MSLMFPAHLDDPDVPLLEPLDPDVPLDPDDPFAPLDPELPDDPVGCFIYHLIQHFLMIQMFHLYSLALQMFLLRFP
jgi:hypothetical protein